MKLDVECCATSRSLTVIPLDIAVFVPETVEGRFLQSVQERDKVRLLRWREVDSEIAHSIQIIRKDFLNLR